MGKTTERTQGDFYHLQVFFLAEKNEKYTCTVDLAFNSWTVL